MLVPLYYFSYSVMLCNSKFLVLYSINEIACFYLFLSFLCSACICLSWVFLFYFLRFVWSVYFVGSCCMWSCFLSAISQCQNCMWVLGDRFESGLVYISVSLMCGVFTGRGRSNNNLGVSPPFPFNIYLCILLPPFPWKVVVRCTLIV